jgi:hypothetical protein
MGDFKPGSGVVFTLPGKLGDNLARLPIAARYARSRGMQVDVCVDAQTAPALLPLLARLPWVAQAWSASGIVHDGCGGQPWDFGAPRWFAERYAEVYHCGYRQFPRWGCLTDESVPPNWPADLSREGLLSERPLGLSWSEEGWVSGHRCQMITTHSSRPYADKAASETIGKAWKALLTGGRMLAPTTPLTPLYETAESMARCVVLTTYSAMCQLATLVGAPCVVLIPPQGYGLGHYDTRRQWYPGWEIATEGDAEGLVAAVDRAIEAASGANALGRERV